MRRRILVVSNLYPPVVRGGYEVECRDVVEHLRERHEVTVLASTLGAAGAGRERGVLRSLPWVGDERKRDSFLALARAAQGRRAVERALALVRPDVIYVWNAASMPAATLRALQRSGLPMLVRVCEYWFGVVYQRDPLTRYLPGGSRGPGETGGPEALWGAATRAANHLPGLRFEFDEPLPAAVCWNSAFVEARAPAPPGIAVAHRAVVIPSNARTDELAGIPRAPVAGRVLFVGRLDERKGAATVVRALGELQRRHGVRADLVAVGDGSPEQRAEMLAVAGQEGVADRVRLAGLLRGEAFAAEVAAASAWCVPSVWDEPAPLTCTEAALGRVPAVFSRVGGIGEMFAEGSEALFYPPGDHVACAAALADCLAGGAGVQARVNAAFARGRELGFAPYLRAMDAFLEDGLAALAHSAPAAASRSTS